MALIAQKRSGPTRKPSPVFGMVEGVYPIPPYFFPYSGWESSLTGPVLSISNTVIGTCNRGSGVRSQCDLGRRIRRKAR